MTRHLDAVPLACAGTKIGMAVASLRSESSLLALAGVMAAVGSVSLLDRLAILAKSPNLSVSQAESHFAPLILCSARSDLADCACPPKQMESPHDQRGSGE